MPHLVPSPYPYERWAQVDQRQAKLNGYLSRLCWDGDAGLHTAGKVLGTAVTLVELGPWRVAENRQEPLCIQLSNPSMGLTATLTVSTVAARQVADRILGGPGDVVGAHLPGPLSPFATGALAYLVARVLPPLTPDFVLEQVQTMPQTTANIDERQELTRELQFYLAGQPLRATFQVTTPSHPPSAPLPNFQTAPKPVRALPITLVADAGSAWLPLHDVQTLEVGDVLVPDHCQLLKATEKPSECTGSVRVRIAGSRRGHYQCHAQGQNLLWAGSRERNRLKSQKARNMPPSNPPPSNPSASQIISADTHRDPVELNGDAPIQVTLEIARFTLPLETLASLAEGDILQTGSAIGSQITLCAAGVPVATGELVNVDGEVGVCIGRVKTGRNGDTPK